MDCSDEMDSSGEWILEKVGPPMDFLTASSLGVREMVRYHLNRGQDINERSKAGWTALMYACASHRNDIVWFFLNSGADISAVDEEGRHFLTVTAENGNLKALRLLRNWMNVIQEDATESVRCEIVKSIINLPEKKTGFTPLMLAAQQSNDEMVALLISMGADNSKRDNMGRNASELAALNGHKTTSWLLKFCDKFTIKDVLEDAGLLKYHDLFAHISIEHLLRFDEGDLKMLGLNLLGPRKKLLRTLEKLNVLKLKRFEVLCLDLDKDGHSATLEQQWRSNTEAGRGQDLFSLST